jgi:hypothetical protein
MAAPFYAPEHTAFSWYYNTRVLADNTPGATAGLDVA